MEVKFLWLTNLCTIHTGFPIFGLPLRQSSSLVPQWPHSSLAFSLAYYSPLRHTFLESLSFTFIFFIAMILTSGWTHHIVFMVIVYLSQPWAQLYHYHGHTLPTINRSLLFEMASSLKVISFARRRILKGNTWLLVMLTMQCEMRGKGSETQSYSADQKIRKQIDQEGEKSTYCLSIH